MMLINPSRKCAYYGMGKTGTTSILDALGFTHSSHNPNREINGWIFADNQGDFNQLLQGVDRSYTLYFLLREPRARWCSGFIEIVKKLSDALQGQENTINQLSDPAVFNSVADQMFELCNYHDAGFSELSHLYLFVEICYC